MSVVEIVNRKATHLYHFVQSIEAGVMLKSTEIKSIREGKAALSDSFCYFKRNELYVRNLHISEYSEASFKNHEPTRERKLLLNKHELNKLIKKMVDKGLTIVPTKLFINEKGYAKLEIALAKGKKLYDKRDDIKKKDIEREMNRKF